MAGVSLASSPGSSTAYIGKEGNRLDERLGGLVTDPVEYRSHYMDPSHAAWSELVLPVLATMDRGEVARRSGLTRKAFERYLYKGVRPSRRHEAMLTNVAVEWSRVRLVESGGLELPRTDEAILYRHLEVLGGGTTSTLDGQ
jgi:hypothetical protein